MNHRRGQAFLSVVLLIGAIVLVVGTTIAFITVTFIDSSYGTQASQQAEAAAGGGVNDAYLNLVRYGMAWCPTAYAIPVGSVSVSVTCSPNTPNADLATVLSTATVQYRTRKIRVAFSIDPVTGQVAQVSWNEVQ